MLRRSYMERAQLNYMIVRIKNWLRKRSLTKEQKLLKKKDLLNNIVWLCCFLYPTSIETRSKKIIINHKKLFLPSLIFVNMPLTMSFLIHVLPYSIDILYMSMSYPTIKIDT
jgi:hypothetical protein